MKNFQVNLSGVKDFNAGVVIAATNQQDADKKADKLARYEEEQGGIADWENQLKDVHGVSVVDVTEAQEGEEPDAIDWAAVDAALGESAPETEDRGETIEVIPDYQAMFKMFLAEAELTAEHLKGTSDEEFTLAHGKGLMAELNIALNAMSSNDDLAEFRAAFQRIVTKLDDETRRREMERY